MSAFQCPDCGGIYLDWSFDDFLICDECGATSHQDDCRIKVKKSDKKVRKARFDDGSGNPPKEKKVNYRRENNEIEEDYYED